MAKTRGYKRVENELVRKSGEATKRGFAKIWSGIAGFFKGGQNKLTIMIVPHSQKKVMNFQATVFSVAFFFIIIAGILGGFFVYTRYAVSSNASISDLKASLAQANYDRDRMKESTESVLKAADKFSQAMASTLSTVGLEMPADSNQNTGNGDFNALFNTQQAVSGNLLEVSQLNKLSDYLNASAQSISDIGKLVQSQTSTFSDIPNLWPLKGGVGHFSMLFGRNKHPITGVWYLHKGLDIANWRYGDPILSTANGQVVSVEKDMFYGNTVIIKHKHGFYTRYAHMQTFAVQRGQFVSQGDLVGYVGNTGQSTGPHLHYEVHVGSDVVDPMSYLNITKQQIEKVDYSRR